MDSEQRPREQKEQDIDDFIFRDEPWQPSQR